MKPFFSFRTGVFDRIKNAGKALSIRKKLALLYVIFVFLPALILGFYFYKRASGIIEQEVTKTIFQALKQAELNISYRLENAKNISNIVFGDSSLMDYLRSTDGDKTAYEHIQDVRAISALMDSAEYQGNVYKLRLFTAGKMILPSEREQFGKLADFQARLWYPDVEKLDGRIYWKSTYLETYPDGTAINVISAARIIRSPMDWNEIAGVLMVDIPESGIRQILSEIELSENQNIYIFDADGRIVSGENGSVIGSLLSEIKPDRSFLVASPEGVYTVGSGKDHTFLISKKIALTGWTIVSEIPKSELMSRNSIVDSLSAAILIIVTLVFFMFAVVLLFSYIAESLIGRMQNVTRRIEACGMEAYDRRNEKAAAGRLEESVEAMIGTVKRLTEESYQAKLKERDAQLTALQAQINPHFLYNTLDAINWMAIKKNAEDISFMLDALARYFRLSLNNGRDIVSLRDEIELARVYLKIQKVRYGSDIVTEFDIEPEAEDCLIPKLTLQPVIENALLHGIIRARNRTGFIRVRANRDGRWLILTVEDNGIGMNPEIIDGLFSPNRPGTGGYGIFNVNERIRLFSNGEGGIRITSTPGSGTVVEMSLYPAGSDNQ